MAGFEWHSFIYYFIEKLNMTEEVVLDYNYIEALNWMSFFFKKNEKDSFADGTRLA